MISCSGNNHQPDEGWLNRGVLSEVISQGGGAKSYNKYFLLRIYPYTYPTSLKSRIHNESLAQMLPITSIIRIK